MPKSKAITYYLEGVYAAFKAMHPFIGDKEAKPHLHAINARLNDKLVERFIGREVANMQKDPPLPTEAGATDYRILLSGVTPPSEPEPDLGTTATKKARTPAFGNLKSAINHAGSPPHTDPPKVRTSGVMGRSTK